MSRRPAASTSDSTAGEANVLEHYVPPRCLLPELDMLGWDRHFATVNRLAAHVHPQAYEICVIVGGEVEWWAGREVFQVRPGDVYITRPGEEHGGVDSMMHPCELYFFQIALPLRRALPGLTVEQTRSLADALARLRLRCFPGSDAVSRGMELLLSEQRQPGRDSVLMMRATLHSLLVQVLRDHDAALHRRPSLSPLMGQAVQWMQQRLGEDYAVTDVAASVGLSVNHFQTRFRRELGLTPAEYRTRCRIRLARELLSTTRTPITGIAHRLGFASSQYFATVFRRQVGMTPGEYRSIHTVRGQTAAHHVASEDAAG